MSHEVEEKADKGQAEGRGAGNFRLYLPIATSLLIRVG
jgi:hypothetical protein